MLLKVLIKNGFGASLYWWYFDQAFKKIDYVDEYIYDIKEIDYHTNTQIFILTPKENN